MSKSSRSYINSRASSLELKTALFMAGFRHSLNDGFWALVPVAIAVAGLAFIIWFWSNGPTDLFALVGIQIDLGVLTKLASTLVIGFPTVIFVISSFQHFMLVMNEKGPIYREFDDIVARFNERDARRAESARQETEERERYSK